MVERSELFDALCAVASEIGLELRHERLIPPRSTGGLFKLRGRWVIALDETASLPDRIATLALALTRFDLQGVSISEEVRRHLKAMSRRIPKGHLNNTLPLEIPARKPGLRWARHPRIDVDEK